MNKFGYDRRLSRVTCVVAVLCFSLITAFTTPAWSQASASDQQQGTAAGAGMQAAAAVSTILYFPFKGAFAIGGGIVGGLAYLFSGGSEQTAKSIWIPSMYGTYVIVPEHLTGDRPVRFLGVAAESEHTTPVPVQ